MKFPLRSMAALSAIAALCIAAPAAFAARPADAPEHPAHPGHPAQANEHSFDAGQAQDGVTAIGDDSHTTETSTDTPAAPPAPVNPCNQPATRRVFSPWHDRKGYVLTENGGAEKGDAGRRPPGRARRGYVLTGKGGLEKGDAGWTLGDGAAVTEGNDPFFLNDAADHQSMSLPAGSSATSPATCFTAGSPTFRSLARTNGDRQARLRVEVLYTNPNGRKVTRTAGKVRGGDAWGPSKILALAIGRG